MVIKNKKETYISALTREVEKKKIDKDFPPLIVTLVFSSIQTRSSINSCYCSATRDHQLLKLSFLQYNESRFISINRISMAWDSVHKEIILNSTSLMNSLPLGLTSSKSEQTISLENRLPIKVTFITLYALIFFFGITGNALVVGKCE